MCAFVFVYVCRNVLQLWGFQMDVCNLLASVCVLFIPLYPWCIPRDLSFLLKTLVWYSYLLNSNSWMIAKWQHTANLNNDGIMRKGEGFFSCFQWCYFHTPYWDRVSDQRCLLTLHQVCICNYFPCALYLIPCTFWVLSVSQGCCVLKIPILYSIIQIHASVKVSRYSHLVGLVYDQCAHLRIRVCWHLVWSAIPDICSFT